MTAKDYVDILSGLLTPVIAIIAVFIAWQQYTINRASLNNQLYERRLRVFKVVVNYISTVIRDGKASIENTSQFYSDAKEADFLFHGNEVSQKIEELYRKGVILWEIRNDLYPENGDNGLPVGEERSRRAKESGDCLKWFVKQLKETRDIFQRHMQIK
ncbi:hypothetical protein [Desulfatibacillum aliphaticivorans]|nr:hypothetical protein [Desulfatibacillum aliphaticivorans]